MANVLTRIAGATAAETGERTKDVLAQAFPLMTASPYIKAIQSLPGMGLASAIGQRAGIFGKPDKEKQKEKEQKEELEIEKESLVTLDSILKELIKLGDVIKGDVGKAETKPSTAKILEKKEDVEALKEGYTFEPPKGKGKGGYKSTKTGRYVKKEEAVAVKKAPVTPKMGIMARTGQAVAGAGRAVGAGVARVGAMAGGALPWLAAFAAILPFFLPKDIKSVIGDVFEAILRGIGLEQDTIDALFVPFQILSDIAEAIKKILGVIWDGVKSIIGVIGNIIEWFKGRSKVNAAEEVSKATGGKGHGEFVTGGETDTGYGDASVPIPDTALPPRETTSTVAARVPTPTPPPAATPSPTTTPAAVQAAPVAAPAAPTPAPAPAPVSAEPMFPQKVTEEEAGKIHEWFNKPENAGLNAQYDELYNRANTLKRAIASTKALIRSETDPVKVKEHERVLKEELEPGLERTQKQRKEILNVARQSIRKEGYSDGAPVGMPPPATPTSTMPLASSSGGGGAQSDSTSDTGGVGTSGAAPVASAPSTGQEIDAQSKQIEAARLAGPTPEGSTSIIDKGEIVGGTQDVIAPPVPSPVAPRDKLDLDVFFVAAA